MQRLDAAVQGGEQSVTGSGFVPGEGVQATLRSDPVDLGVFTADGDIDYGRLAAWLRMREVTNVEVVGIATAKARDAEGIGLAVPIKIACDEFKIC